MTESLNPQKILSNDLENFSHDQLKEIAEKEREKIVYTANQGTWTDYIAPIILITYRIGKKYQKAANKLEKQNEKSLSENYLRAAALNYIYTYRLSQKPSITANFVEYENRPKLTNNIKKQREDVNIITDGIEIQDYLEGQDQNFEVFLNNFIDISSSIPLIEKHYAFAERLFEIYQSKGTFQSAIYGVAGVNIIQNCRNMLLNTELSEYPNL